MKTIDHNILAFTDRTMESISQPVVDDRHVIATDKAVLIKAPVSYVERTFEPITKSFPNYKAIIPEHDCSTILFELDPKSIYDETSIMPRKEKWEACDMCEGDGNLYTVNNNSIDCPDCGGSGNETFLGNLIPIPVTDDGAEEAYVINIFGVLFNPNLLEEISRLAIKLQQPIKWVLLHDRRPNVIYISDIMILLMPIMIEVVKIKNDYPNTTVININPLAA